MYYFRCYHGHVSSVKVLSDYKKARGVEKSKDVSMVRNYEPVDDAQWLWKHYLVYSLLCGSCISVWVWPINESVN